MNLLGAILYDPSSSATKACTANIAMTAFDTTNLRQTVTVPAHGMVRIKMMCAIEGAATYPQILLGVMVGASVKGRVSPQITINGTALATTRAVAMAEFTITGLSPGSTVFDAAYGVEFLVASSNIRYGGPDNSTASDAWGAFVFEIWDPRPLTLALDGAVNVKQWNGGAVPAPNVAGVPIVDDKYLLGTAYSTPATAGIQDINVKNMNNVAATAITTVKAVQGLATDGVVPTVTTLTNLPAITSNWLTAAGIAAAALNGKGDWNIGKTGYALSAAGVQAFWDALTSALTTVGSIGKKLADWTVGTAQTGDAYARLGAPAGASVSADIAAIQSDTDNIQTRIPAALDINGFMKADVEDWKAATAAAMTGDAFARLGAPAGASVSADVAAVNAKTTNLPASPASTTNITAATGITVSTNNDKTGYGLSAAGVQAIWDALTSALITSGSIGKWILDKLDVVLSTRLSTSGYTAPLDAAATRSAVGLASANLDTQLDALPTNAELATALGTADDATLAAISGVNSDVSAIKTKTDQLTFTVTGEVDANIKCVNDIEITGTGETNDSWGPA